MVLSLISFGRVREELCVNLGLNGARIVVRLEGGAQVIRCKKK